MAAGRPIIQQAKAISDNTELPQYRQMSEDQVCHTHTQGSCSSLLPALVAEHTYADISCCQKSCWSVRAASVPLRHRALHIAQHVSAG